jgi:hypothetical protein
MTDKLRRKPDRRVIKDNDDDDDDNGDETATEIMRKKTQL